MDFNSILTDSFLKISNSLGLFCAFDDAVKF